MRLVAIPELSPGGPPRPPGPEFALRGFGGETMGTTWSVRCYAAQQEIFDDAERAVRGCLDRVVRQMSHYLPESDLCRFNAARAGKWVELPEPFFGVLRTALIVSKETRGAFDPTIGRLVDLWGFGTIGGTDGPPDPAELGTAMADSGWGRILLDEVRCRAWQPGGVALNLSSIAKGFAVDEAAHALEGLGIESYLAEIGGELRARGIKADGQPWWVAVESPPGAKGCPEAVIALCGQAVATSGGYRRRYKRQGREYTHSIDPHTGSAVSNGIVSVTVIDRHCALADAYSTAILVLGEEAGKAFAEAKGLAAFIVTRDDGQYRHACSRAFQTLVDG